MITGVDTRIDCERTCFGFFALLPFAAIAVVRGCNSFDCVIPNAERGAAPESSV